jgi:hypothetical protein
MKILGITPGSIVGEIIQALHEQQLTKNVRTKDEAKAFVQAYASKIK